MGRAKVAVVDLVDDDDVFDCDLDDLGGDDLREYDCDDDRDEALVPPPPRSPAVANDCDLDDLDAELDALRRATIIPRPEEEVFDTHAPSPETTPSWAAPSSSAADPEPEPYTVLAKGGLGAGWLSEVFADDDDDDDDTADLDDAACDDDDDADRDADDTSLVPIVSSGEVDAECEEALESAVSSEEVARDSFPHRGALLGRVYTKTPMSARQRHRVG